MPHTLDAHDRARQRLISIIERLIARIEGLSLRRLQVLDRGGDPHLYESELAILHNDLRQYENELSRLEGSGKAEGGTILGGTILGLNEGGAKHKSPESGKVQAVLFSKAFYDKAGAQKEFERLGKEDPEIKLLPHKQVHETKQFFRYRVKTPNYKKYNYRTIWFADDGSIRAIYEYPKEAGTYVSTRFRR